MLFQRLRSETRDLHEQIERRLPVFQADFDRADYIELLSLYLGFYTPVELALERLREHGLSVFTDDRRKRPLLTRDLESFHASPNPPAAGRSEIPQLETVAQGIGCMYVLEGSTLGGQLISRHLEKKLGVTADAGGAFFASYGDNLGRKWNEFRAAVSAGMVAETNTDETVQAARDTFQCFDLWLGQVVERVR